MKIIFLGTGTMFPTKERNPSAILINYKNENILVDCAEGTQRQLRTAKISPAKITKILITHWHGDHVFGLPGLLQTIASTKTKKTLEIYGPIGTKNFMKIIHKVFIPERRLDVKTTEIKKQGKFFENKEFQLESYYLDHLTKCLGYSFVEKDKRKIDLNYVKKFGLKNHPLLGKLQKGQNVTYKGKRIPAAKATKIKKGKKISIILDTRLCQNAIKLAKNSDILITEATFLSELEKLAKEYGHLTAEQAATIAKKSKSKKLILTHFSQRYKDVNKIKKEASKIFKNVSISKDFLTISV